MINVIITGHGKFATGMLSSVEQIIGPQAAIEAIDFMPQMSTEDLNDRFQKVLERLANDANIMCYCDLLGGSPFRCGVEFSISYPNMRVIAGTNLQMLVETLMERDDIDDIDEYANMAKACAFHGIVLFNDSSEQPKSIEITDDSGI